MTTNRAKRWGFNLVLVGLTINVAGIFMLFAPDYFEATAVVAVNSDMPSWSSSRPDPTTVQAELNVMKSEAVLDKVVQALHWGEKWGVNYSKSLLKKSLRLSLVRNTELIDIGFISKDPAEAAQVANLFADKYFTAELPYSTKRINPGHVVEAAVVPAIPMDTNRNTSKLLLCLGVLVILAGVMFLRRASAP